MSPHEPSEDHPEWIETVSKVAGMLGMNQVRVRWKLLRWREERKKKEGAREQKRTHIRYGHKTCPHCTAVNDVEETTCHVCKRKLPSRRWQVLGRMGLTPPALASLSNILALLMAIVYVRVAIADGGDAINLSIATLADFGGHIAAQTRDGDWWRLATAAFLHAGVVHIAFNLIGLAIIGPRLEELYGRLTLPLFFLGTAVLANIGTIFVHPPGTVGIGASGGLMGLVGVAIGHGHRDGTARGRHLRDDMVKWSLYVFLFGFFIGADNWAHGFGLAAGIAIGWLVRPGAYMKLRAVRIGLGALATAACVATCAYIVSLSPKDLPDEVAEVLAQEIVRVKAQKDACATGDAASCKELADLREQCQARDLITLMGLNPQKVAPRYLPALRKMLQELCDAAK